MSIDLHIPVSSPLEVRAFTERTHLTFEEILGVKTSQNLMVRQVIGQEQLGELSVEVLTQEESSPYLIVSFDEETKFGIMISPAQWDGENSPTASLSPFGGNRTREGLILCAACAVSIARNQNSFVEDPIPILGSNFRYEPEQLLDLLRTRTSHTTTESAVAEVLENIRRAKQER